MLDEVYDVGYLVDSAAVVVGPRPPLMAIDRTKVAVLVGPFVPDGNLIVVQVLNVGVASQEPQQFMNDTAQMQLLRRQQRKAVGQVEAHLVAEHALRARARAVGLHSAFVEYALQQVKILFHDKNFVQKYKLKVKRTLYVAEKMYFCTRKQV